MSNQDHWREIARATKRALAGNKHQVTLQGQPYQVAYRARIIKDDRDYAIIKRLATGRKLVFDVGANLGATSLVMSAVVDPAGQIYAFEASEAACRVIEENMRLNELAGRVQVVNAVMLDKSGQVVDFFWDYTSGGASIISGYLGHKNPLQKASLALDDFVEQKGIMPEFLKVDVEGAERLVLRGMARLLKNGQPTVFVELHSWEGQTVVDNASQILPFVNEIGYRMFYLQQKSWVDEAAIFTGRGRCHVLLLPQGQEIPDWLNDFDTTTL
ncbi:MAG: FkbM family methyltransferase [Anaerolineales bacterium]|nr:FkbM family methyltransferase [Anaerolineales bacterium]MCB0027273.1 FkbM family methyltransferase [Anaerolineales bacterium]